MTQIALGETLGVSRRTIIRWQTNQSRPGVDQARELEAMVRDEDEDLADELCASLGMDPEEATEHEPAHHDVPPLPPPTTPGAAGAPYAAAPAHLVDSIVCVAADAANLVPRAMRPALLAALRRTSELGLRLESVLLALAADAPARQRDEGSVEPAP